MRNHPTAASLKYLVCVEESSFVNFSHKIEIRNVGARSRGTGDVGVSLATTVIRAFCRCVNVVGLRGKLGDWIVDGLISGYLGRNVALALDYHGARDQP